MRILAAVGDVEVIPTILIEIDDGYSRSHRGDLRHDVRESGIESRSTVLEMNARYGGAFPQMKTVIGERRGLSSVGVSGSLSMRQYALIDDWRSEQHNEKRCGENSRLAHLWSQRAFEKCSADT